MTSSAGAYLEVSQAYNDGLSNSSLYDINFYTSYVNQQIHIGNTYNTYPKLTINSNGIGISNVNPLVSLDMGSKDALKIPVGTTAQRPLILKEGLLRYNTTTTKYECYSNNNWNNFVLLNTNNTLSINNSFTSNALDITGNVNISSNIYINSKVGIGSTNPLYSLDVNGSTNISSNLFVSTKVGIGTTNPLYSLDVRGVTNFNSNIYIGTKVGIGTTNPLYSLDIIGTGSLSSNLYVSSNISIANDIYICDKSSNNFIVPTYGNISIIKNTSPFSLSSINECIYTNTINNLNNYIQFNNSIFQFNWWTTGLTVESWINIKSYDSSANPAFVGLTNFSGTAQWLFGSTSTGTLCFYYNNGGNVYLNSTATLSLNTWYHVAMTYDTSTSKINLWINGIFDSQSTISGTPQATISTLTIGRIGVSYYSDLYFTNLRITKSCLYTTNFTVSQIPLTSVTNTILLLTTDKKTPLYNLDINGSLSTTALYNLASYNKDDYEFPPLGMTGNTTTLSDGTYIAFATFDAGATYAAWKAFNKTFGVDSDCWANAGTVYTPSTGIYNFTTSTTNIDGSGTYLGDYIQLQMPNPIILTKYKLFPRLYSGASTAQNPMEFKLFGSINGLNWVTLDSQYNQQWRTNIGTKTYVSFNNYKTFYVKNNTTAYSYYRLSVSKVPSNISAEGGNGGLSIGELKFYGKKVNDNTSNTNSNLTNIFTQDINVGIGTTSPMGRLHIYNSNSVEDTLILTNGNNGTQFYKSQIKFGYYDGSDTYNGRFAHYISTRHNTGASNYNSIDFYCCNTAKYNSIKGGSKLVMTLEGTGNVGIGSTTPAYQLDLGAGEARKITSGNWTIGSDKRIKDNIEIADYNKCYEIMSNLDLKYYKWCDYIPEFSNLRDKHILGWIADDVELYIPKAITIEKEVYGLSNFKSLNTDQIYANMYGVLKYLIKKKELLEINQKKILNRLNNL
jgi:hypothetical protein